MPPQYSIWETLLVTFDTHKPEIGLAICASRSPAQFCQTPKIRSVTLQSAEWGLQLYEV